MRIKSILVLLVVLLVLGGYFYYTSRPKPAAKPEPRQFVWLIEMEEIKHIDIRLLHENKSQSWVMGEDRGWYFDDSQRSPVDMQRWGGGIPLLLSGPEARRVVAKDATLEKLDEFGLTRPLMEISLLLEGDLILDIKVGNKTPDGAAYYIQVPGTNDVALVDYTWYDVLARLVTEPPYATLTPTPTS